MKQLIIILALFLVACSTQEKESYIVEGEISGKVPASVKLMQRTNGKYITVDSTNFTNGEFKFKGKISTPEMYLIKIGDQRPISFFIENSHIEITAHIDSLQQAKIEGSATQDEFDRYTESNQPFTSELEILYKTYKESINEETKKIAEIAYDSLDALLLEHKKEYIRANSTTVVAPYIIRREIVYYLNLEELEELTNTLSPELKDSKYTQELMEKITTLRSLKPGMAAPLFTQTDTEGNPINLADYKGQYVLIDFWASWCGPCRRANPTVLAVYNKYKTKNFSILGISLDDSKEAWLEAIKKDELPWTQVSTLEGWTNPVVKPYSVNSIPHAILIDPEGNIVKRGIHAGELDELLFSLLQ